jgi:hypothetical protein
LGNDGGSGFTLGLLPAGNNSTRQHADSLKYGRIISVDLEEKYAIIYKVAAPSSSLVRTNGSQPLNTGSNPVGATNKKSRLNAGFFIGSLIPLKRHERSEPANQAAFAGAVVPDRSEGIQIRLGLLDFARARAKPMRGQNLCRQLR